MDKTKNQFASRLDEVWQSKVRINATDLTAILDMAYKTRSKWTICIVGESGIGKSMIPETYAKKNGLGFINLKGSGLLPEDIRGFGTISKSVDKEKIVDDPAKNPSYALAIAVNEYISTSAEYAFHLMPQLEQAFTPGWKGILMLDEFAQASKEVQDVYFQIIYDRRIDEKVLSDDVLVIAAMNPPCVEEYSLNPLTKAAEDRFEFYVYQPTYVEWCKWANEFNIYPTLIEYVRNSPSCFEDNKGRRLHNFSDRLYAMEQLGLTSQRLISAAAHACLAGGHATSFIKFMSGVGINTTDILGFSNSIEETLTKIKALPEDRRVGMIVQLNKELLGIIRDRDECIRIVKHATEATKKAGPIKRTKSEQASECSAKREELKIDSSDADIVEFAAKALLFYAMSFFDTNADLIVSFVKDLSISSFSDLKSAMNTLMRLPVYSSMVQEVLKCQMKAKKQSN